MEIDFDNTHNTDAYEKDTPAPGSGETVGYCRPPKAHQFRKGKSGNPNGRPKKTKFTHLRDAIGTKLDEVVKLETANGRKAKLSTLRRIIRSMVEKAATGDRRSLMEIIRISETKDGQPPNKPDWVIFRYSDALCVNTVDELDEDFFRENEKYFDNLNKALRKGGSSVGGILQSELLRKVTAVRAGKSVKVAMYEVIVSRLLSEALKGDVQTFRLLQKLVPQKQIKRDYSRMEILRPTQRELDVYGGTAKPRPPIPGIDGEAG